MSKTSVTAFAPASVGNVAVGFDILGHALSGQGDRVTIRTGRKPGVRIADITGLDVALPLEAERNTAGRAVQALVQHFKINTAVEISIDKGIPLASGLGGSAASAVAAVVAANDFFELGLDAKALYPFALAGETVASSSAHGDNIAPQLLGGLVLVAADELISVPVPKHLTAVAIHPHCQVATADARRLLQNPFTLETVVAQTANLALVLSGCYRNDCSLLAKGLSDAMIEPRRTGLIPGYAEVKQAALEAQALGAAISGAGPTVCAWFESASHAQTAAAAMQSAFANHQLESDRLICPVDSPPARIEGMN